MDSRKGVVLQVWGLGEVLTTPPYKTFMLRNTCRHDASSGDKTIRRYTTPPLGSPGGVFLGEATRKIHREMKLGTWKVRSFYRAGSLKAAARELARYKLHVVGVQEVSWDKEGTVRAGDYDFFLPERK